MREVSVGRTVQCLEKGFTMLRTPRAACQLVTLLRQQRQCLRVQHLQRNSSDLGTFQCRYTLSSRLNQCHNSFSTSACILAKKNKKEKVSKKGHKATTQELTNEELNSVINFDKMKDSMEQALQTLRHEFTEQLALRTNLASLDQLPVDTPDGRFNLIQLAQITQKNPQLVVVNLSSAPQYIKAVQEALQQSGMNLNPQQDGTTLFIPLPKVTKEHRENLAKNAKSLCNKTKDKLRDIQNNFLRDLKKHKEGHPENLIRGTETTILNTAKTYSESAETLTKEKQKELLG